MPEVPCKYQCDNPDESEPDCDELVTTQEFLDAIILCNQSESGHGERSDTVHYSRSEFGTDINQRVIHYFVGITSWSSIFLSDRIPTYRVHPCHDKRCTVVSSL